MSGFSSLSKKLSTARRVFQEDGFSGIASIVWQKADLHVRLLAARGTKSIELDGCTFDLKRVPAGPMKLSLLKREYEGTERRMARQFVDPEKPLIELGGCIGVVACITNRLLRNPALHVVVEASPEVIPLLEESRRRNRCHFEIVNAAISYGQDFAMFSTMKELSASALSGETGAPTVKVPATSLHDIAERRSFKSFNLICDIEGAEYDLVMNEPDVLQRADTIILEAHERFIGQEKMTRMMSRLDKLGYRIADSESFTVVLRRFDESV